MTTPAHKRSWLAPILIGGGGLLTVGAVVFGVRKSGQVTQAIEKQVEAPPIALPPSPQAVALLPTFNARLTGYWPFKEGLSTKERLMEGGKKDRMSKPLIALEQHLQDPVKYPYVSVAGDWKIFPYGQRLIIDAWPGAVFRVVDTGGNFFGAKKVYRIAGYEPLDICQWSSDVKKPTTASVKIVPGDHFGATVKKGSVKDVVTTAFKDQSVRLTGDDVIREGHTPDDYEALARMVESETGGRTVEEQHAAAWVARNRAADLSLTVHDLLAPQGKYGSPQKSGGYASTRRVPTDRARLVAAEVLDAWPWVDPTGGAVEFWMPGEQGKLRALGDVYRASSAGGDAGDARKMKSYARYANYGTEADVRAQHENDGLHVVGTVGSIELLGRMM